MPVNCGSAILTDSSAFATTVADAVLVDPVSSDNFGYFNNKIGLWLHEHVRVLANDAANDRTNAGSVHERTH